MQQPISPSPDPEVSLVDTSHGLLNRRRLPKSKRGCATCKKRHVKCDEKQPTCDRCLIGHRECVYTGPKKRRDFRNARTQPEAGSQTGSTKNGQGTSVIPTTTTTPRTRSTTALLSSLGEGGFGSVAPGHFDALHMGLFYHAVLNMSTYMALDGDMAPIFETALDSATTAPYLFDQVLALAALHRSVIDRENSRLYLHHATSLQTRALSQFNDTDEHLSDATIIPSFLFTTLVGFHVLRNTLADHQDNAASFVGAFVSYLRVRRGARLVTKHHWDRIRDSKLAPLLEISRISAQSGHHEPGPETEALLTHLLAQPGHVNGSAASVCIEALEWCQWVANLQNLEPTRLSVRVHAATAWPLVIPDEFADALYQRRPEALAVLVHYLAILYRAREFWVFESCGSPLIRAIADHIGPFWEEALQWPLSCGNE